MNQPVDLERANASTGNLERMLGRWWVIAAISIVLLLLTFNPVLTGVLPYLRAGWPAVKTGFWLKMVDPWKARGTVGLLFHLCMAGFCAGACGVVCLIVTVILNARFNKHDLDLVSFLIAMGAILLGCFLSFVLGWLGIALALRHGIRVYVKSNLYDACRGDLNAAKTLPPHHNRTNPANFILTMSISVTLLALWFVAMLAIMPSDWSKDEGIMPGILLGMLPVLGIACILIVLFLSNRIVAASPADCWGPEPLELAEDESNWYRTAD